LGGPVRFRHVALAPEEGFPMVPASTKVKFKRVGNVDTDRLIRRLQFMRATSATFARAADARIEVRMFAREMLSIEAELVSRGVCV
jgi:hypothetical protein